MDNKVIMRKAKKLRADLVRRVHELESGYRGSKSCTNARTLLLIVESAIYRQEISKLKKILTEYRY